jgi:membrane associated rhomboid family serine protease
MIPLRDRNRPETFPGVTATLIALNVLMWLYELSFGRHLDRFVFAYGLTPARFWVSYWLDGGIVGNAIYPLFTSMFMHGGWMHLIWNMWYLWIFGDNVEDRLGHGRFLLFYLLCGVVAALAHVILHSTSRMPLVGASGAISGVLGAYLVSFPTARIFALVFIFFMEIPAALFLVLWFVFQFMSGASELGGADGGGVAYWAHIGGFVAGIFLVRVFGTRSRFGDPVSADDDEYPWPRSRRW